MSTVANQVTISMAPAGDDVVLTVERSTPFTHVEVTFGPGSKEPQPKEHLVYVAEPEGVEAAKPWGPSSFLPGPFRYMYGRSSTGWFPVPVLSLAAETSRLVLRVRKGVNATEPASTAFHRARVAFPDSGEVFYVLAARG